MTRRTSDLRDAVRAIGRTHPDSDLALWAAGLTFFGAIGVVPLVMESLALAGLLVGRDAVLAGVDTALSGLPGGHGTPQAVRTLARTALDLSWLEMLVLLFPTSLYGEGLRRAFLQLSPDRPNAFTGWRGRLALLPVVAIGPALVLAVLAAAPLVAPMYAAGGWRLVLGVVIAFHVVFVLVSVALALTYRVVGPDRVRPRALLLGALATGSVVAGFLQGFILFLAIPLEWSLPFGGLPVFGAVTALVLWLYLLHVLVLVGYRLTLVLEERLR